MRIVFRADAGIEMGIGHVMRCLSLADHLSERGHRCRFVSRERPGHMAAQIAARGHDVSVLEPADDGAGWLGVGEDRDVEQTLESLGAAPVDWIVTDNYAIGAAWERRARKKATRILAIDDLADRVHDCNLLVDQTLGRYGADYAGLIPAGATCLVGADMALLRPRFAQLRAVMADRRAGKIRHLLVSLGGSDPANITAVVMDAIDRCSWPEAVTAQIVLGSVNPWITEIRQRAAQSPWPMEVVVDTPDMAQLMAKADLAIGAAGTTSWERCCLGLPSIIIVTAENQRKSAEGLIAAGAALGMDMSGHMSEVLYETLSNLVARPALVATMSERAANLVDGLGCLRVADAMEKHRLGRGCG